jgi:hypothetical protein
MFAYFKRSKYRNDVLGCLYALLYFYPRGRDAILKDYPGVEAAIKSHFENSVSHQSAAVFTASALLANMAETLTIEQRQLIASQIRALPLPQLKAAIRDAMAARPIPDQMTFGTIMFGNALTIAATMALDKEIEQADADMVSSEVYGVLDGLTAEQRSSERIAATFDEIIPENVLREGDDGELFSIPRAVPEPPLLSGTETEVNLVHSALGIAIVRASDGLQIKERRALSQDDLQKIPVGLDSYTFVNLRATSGDIHSCIIAGEDSDVYGDRRAFWWALARVNVSNTSRKLNVVRITATALAMIHKAARTAWDAAIREAGSIEYMRDMIVPIRNVHFTVINNLHGETTNKSLQLGYAVALAMVLAVQSEDRALEGWAYRAFKQVLWQPGEEPSEFYEHDAAS